jgi:MYXO-CTERM domain-containing protein
MMRRSLTLLATLAASVAPIVAFAQELPRESSGRPWSGYVRTTEPSTFSAPADPQPRRILYLNRKGGTYMYGPSNDASNNVSNIIDQTYTIQPWAVNDEVWRQTLTCSRLMWGRFNVEVTDVDPGQVPHIEAVIAGKPEDVGFSPSTGGVSPWTCGTIERSIVYVFADVYAGNSQRVCEVAAQEIAHSFGLEHEALCEDPMTYLNGCGEKTFQDQLAPCGETDPRACECTGGTTQNSVQLLKERAGPAETEAPTVSFVEPADGATVMPGFTVKPSADDNYIVTKVDLWVDGAQVTGSGIPPFELGAPANLPLGPHTLELRAYDPAGNVGTATIDVTVMGECEGSGPSTCAAGEECVNNVCLGSLGSTCAGHDECASGSCGFLEGTGNLCTRACASGSECPDGFECSNAAGGQATKCWPGSGGGGGCAVGGRGAGGAALFALFALLLAPALRRRR